MSEYNGVKCVITNNEKDKNGIIGVHCFDNDEDKDS